ncbi:MAG: MFS transporter [Bacteroidota bacterium]
MPPSDTDSSTAPRGLLGVLFLGTLLAALDIAIVGPALPALREAFVLSERAATWTFTAFVLANLAGLPVMAALSDRLGRRRVYVADVALFAVGSLIVALAPSFGVLLAGRVVQGLGASGIFPVASAVIGDVYPPESRGRALGLIGAVFGVAFLIGPTVGGIVLAVGSWRWLFALQIPLALLVIMRSGSVLPQERAPDPRPFDLAGVLTLTALLSALVVGLSGLDANAPLAGLTTPWVGGPLALALLLLPVLVHIQRTAAAPVLSPNLVRRRGVQIACVLAVGAGIVEAAFVLLSDYVVVAFNVGQSTASYLLLPLVAGVAVGSPLSGRLLDRIGARPVATAAGVLIAAGLAVIVWAGSLGVHVAGTVLLGLGLSGILGSSLRYILLNEAGIQERTVAQGLSSVFLSVGQLVGAAVLAALAASSAASPAGYRLGFLLVAATGVVLAIAAQFLQPAQRSS